jgi:hypothetical protein
LFSDFEIVESKPPRIQKVGIAYIKRKYDEYVFVVLGNVIVIHVNSLIYDPGLLLRNITEARVDNWLELTEKTFDFATQARATFTNGDIQTKKQILLGLGKEYGDERREK